MFGRATLSAAVAAFLVAFFGTLIFLLYLFAYALGVVLFVAFIYMILAFLGILPPVDYVPILPYV